MINGIEFCFIILVFAADKLLISDTGMGWDDWSVLSREMGLTGYGKDPSGGKANVGTEEYC